MRASSQGRAGSGGVQAGGRRCRVACSYPYTILINVGSLHARPRTWSPTGKPSRTKPMGTVIAGNPVGGERRGLLLPWGVLRHHTLHVVIFVEWCGHQEEVVLVSEGDGWYAEDSGAGGGDVSDSAAPSGASCSSAWTPGAWPFPSGCGPC
jgi:hypothetical protein